MNLARNLTADLIELVLYSPAVGIMGPRQVGKTTIAKNLMAELPVETHYLDLKLESDQRKLSEPQLYLEQHTDKCVILDDIQQMPEILSILPSLIDENPKPGRFLLIATASLPLIQEMSSILAGRIVYDELTMFNLTEVIEKTKMEKHWFLGGFPPALFAPSDEAQRTWIHNFFQTYIERDLPLMGLPVKPQLMRRFWKMLAHYHGSVLNNSTFSRALGVTSPTITRYLDFFENALLVHRLPPFYFKLKKRMVKSPKLYIRDTGLLHYLAGIMSFEDLQGHVLVANSWEGYVVEQIRQNLPHEIDLYYYRTHNGAESDLVLVGGNEPIACIDIQYTSAPKITKGFRMVIDDLGTQQNYVITPHTDTFPLDKKVTACKLYHFLTEQ